MPGLDPGIHPLRKTLAKKMDCRVKPGNDAKIYASFLYGGRGMFWCAARSAADQRERRSWK
jgi:hypothetical protein